MSRTPRRRFVYLGWHNLGNFGDDLLFETWRAALDDDLSVSAPLNRRDYRVKAARFVRDRIRTLGGDRVVLLGGGTTIGFGNWAGHIDRAMKYFGAAGSVIPGAGAAEAKDGFALSIQTQQWSAWQALRNTALFGTRGPLTAAECESHWRSTGVLGDPALLYPALVDVAPRTSTSSVPVVGVCLGSDPTTRFDVDVVAAAIAAHLETRPGAVVKVFQLSGADEAAATAVIDALGRASGGAAAERVRFTGDVKSTMQAIAACDVFVSERLHGAVAAVSVGVPTVPLAYASKCDDFWLSVTGERPAIKVGHTIEQLVDALAAAVLPENVAETARAVEVLQGRLRRSVAVLNDWTKGRIATSALLGTSFADVSEELTR